MRFGRSRALTESDAFAILSNPRRRRALRYLGTRSSGATLGDLADAIAADETGLTPPPPRVRRSVYASLRQTHLPMLHEMGVLEFDPGSGRIRRLDQAREVDRYMGVVTRLGVTWGEYYRALGIGGLFLTVASLADLPPTAAVDPLLWASGTLGLFAGSTLYQLWRQR